MEIERNLGWKYTESHHPILKQSLNILYHAVLFKKLNLATYFEGICGACCHSRTQRKNRPVSIERAAAFLYRTKSATGS
jgi:hypothetical protein